MTIATIHTELVNLITSSYQVEQIYIREYPEDNNKVDCVVLLANKYLKTLPEIVPNIVNLTRHCTNYNLLCYIAFQAKQKIQLGNLYLFTSCQQHNLIYTKEGSKFVLMPSDFDFKSFKSIMIKNRDVLFSKINEFRSGYYVFKERGELALTAFMLHQVMEHSYRCVELLLLSKEKISHSICIHDQYISACEIGYHSIFVESNSQDEYLLNLLTDIYRSTRYELDFSINMDILLQLEYKMESLYTQTIQILDRELCEFDKYNFLDKMPVPDEGSLQQIDNYFEGSLQRVVQLLKSEINVPMAIYVFGQSNKTVECKTLDSSNCINTNQKHYDILLITENEVNDMITKQQHCMKDEGGISLFILSYTYAEVQQQLNHHCRFFLLLTQDPKYLLYSDIANNSFQIAQKDMAEIQFPSSQSTAIWRSRSYKAWGFLEAAKAIDQTESVNIKILLYYQAMEQACLGMLYLFYGLVPKQYKLKYIYQLCCSFWYFPTDIFPRSTQEEIKCYKDFMKISDVVRYKTCISVDWDEVYRYESRCERFLNECETHARKILQTDDTSRLNQSEKIDLV